MVKPTSKKFPFWQVVFLGLWLLSREVGAHILIYRKITNQLIEEYNDLPAQFGPNLPPNGIKVYVQVAVPIKACTEIKPPPRNAYTPYAKFVALIERGGSNCTFELKVRNAQKAQWDAVIVYNNESDELEQMSAQNATGITIPSVFVGRTTGMGLTQYMSPEYVLVVNDELPFNINTQLILPFSILIGLCFLTMIFYMIYKCIRDERRLRRYRLPKRLLKKIPITKYVKNNADLPYDTCVICLDDFVEGDKLRVLPCRHPYHSSCIDPWLTENRRNCPICKRKVFTKGEANFNRNRQSSLDSVTDTDDDTTPLLQQANPSTNGASPSTASASNATAASAATTHHGTFRREAQNASVAMMAEDGATSDDENALLAHQSPSRRVNPFDRSPNLPPHLNEQLNEASGSSWGRTFLSFFRRPQTISVAAPAFLEQAAPTGDGGNTISTSSMPRDCIITTPPLSTSRTSNNILNPNLSGSFKDDDDISPHQSLYEPIAVDTPVAAEEPAVIQNGDADIQMLIPEPDTVFLQPPNIGGLGVVALPNTNIESIERQRIRGEVQRRNFLF